MAQLASAPDCGSGGRGFESHYPPLQWAIAKGLRHRTLTPALLVRIQLAQFGATPLKKEKYGVLAQTVEHLTFNQVVRGSNPRCLTSETFAKAEVFFLFKREQSVYDSVKRVGYGDCLYEYF